MDTSELEGRGEGRRGRDGEWRRREGKVVSLVHRETDEGIC